MKKAFLFDMDGVLADTESMWDKLGYDDLLKSHFGEKLFNQVKIASGTAIKSIFDAFVQAGWQGDYPSFHRLNVAMALEIYPKVPLSPGADDLIHFLHKKDFRIGIVSSSPPDWIELLISRLQNRHLISYVLSVNTHKTLRPKPSPDPYVYAMKALAVTPRRTIILEDSRNGVIAGKASGATVICFTGHNHGYDWQIRPDNADYYAASMDEVQRVVAKLGLE